MMQCGKWVETSQEWKWRDQAAGLAPVGLSAASGSSNVGTSTEPNNGNNFQGHRWDGKGFVEMAGSEDKAVTWHTRQMFGDEGFAWSPVYALPFSGFTETYR